MGTPHQAGCRGGLLCRPCPGNPATGSCAGCHDRSVRAHPIDLIPDFIPVLGYLDDLLIVPAGLAIVILLLPPRVLESSRAKAAAVLERPRSQIAGFIIVFIWLICAAGLGYWLLAR